MKYLLLMLLCLMSPAEATTIVWNGDQLGSDSQMTIEYEDGKMGKDLHWKKIYKVADNVYIAGAGDVPAFLMFLEWFKDPRQPYPNAGAFMALVVDNGRGAVYDGDHQRPIEVHAPFVMGSGGSYALGALNAGASVRKSIEIAKKNDPFTGGAVIVVNTPKR